MSELGQGARSILDAGRSGDDPTEIDRARVRTALKRAIAAGGAIGAAGAASGEAATAAAGKAGGLSLGGLAWKIVLGVVIAAAVVAGVALRGGSGEQAATGAAVSATPALSEAAPAVPAPSVPVGNGTAATPEPRAASAGDEASEAAEPSKGAAPESGRPAGSERAAAPKQVSAAGTASGVAEEDPLQAELRRLREAHKAIQNEDPNKALELLDERAKGNAGGQLGEERAAARVVALCKAGRVAEGRAAAAEFLRANPKSPLADRVRNACPQEASDPP